jgi:vacuolar-type H+-ATPase subunit E/Vma4
MALADLLRQLEEQAAAQTSAILAEARAAAERTVAGATAERERRRAAALAAREHDLRAELARAVDLARREAIAKVLEARAEVLSRVLRRARALLAERQRDPNSVPALTRDWEAALSYVGEEPILIRCPPAYAGWVRARLNGRPATVETDASAAVGLVVRTAGGSLEIDAGLEARLLRLWPRIQITIAQDLEPAG